MDFKKYYSAKGDYLKEHKNYFSKKQLQKDVNFIIDVLNLDKKDKILDLACGHGRHTIELKKHSKQEGLQINFYKQDIKKINLKTKYNKAFLFFSEFGLFDVEKVLKNVTKILKTNGLFLLDCDNVFRLIQYLIKHPRALYQFDFINMELKEKQKNSKGVRYYVVPELRKLFNDHKLKVISIYGNYKKQKLNIGSKRIILIGKKGLI